MHWFNALALNDTYTYDITKHRQHIFHASIFKEQNFLSFRQIRSKDQRSDISVKCLKSTGKPGKYLALHRGVRTKVVDSSGAWTFKTFGRDTGFWVSEFFYSDSRSRVLSCSENASIFSVRHYQNLISPYIYGQCFLCLLAPSWRFRC